MPRRKERYHSGTLIDIPETFPAQLIKYKLRTGMTADQISVKVGRDQNGTLVSGHAISNLLSHDRKPTQRRVGMVLLSRLQELIRSEAATHRTVREKCTPSRSHADCRKDGLAIISRDNLLRRLSDADYNLVLGLAERLDTNRADQTRKQEAIDKLLETAERIEAGL